jgi:pSer/pThr/pTyr-binding forkhead associated (FHA) protein
MMDDLTRISKKTPKTKRPTTKYEYSLLTSIRKTPFTLSKTSKFTIGRKTKNDITIPQYTTSDLHATIKWVKSSFKVTDENSTNGTYLNGKRIEGPTALKNGDKIKIGKFVIKFKAKKIRVKKKK